MCSDEQELKGILRTAFIAMSFYFTFEFPPSGFAAEAHSQVTDRHTTCSIMTTMLRAVEGSRGPDCTKACF